MNSYQLVTKSGNPTAVQVLRGGAIAKIEPLKFDRVDSGAPDGYPFTAWVSESFEVRQDFEETGFILYRNNVAVDFREVRV